MIKRYFYLPLFLCLGRFWDASTEAPMSLYDFPPPYEPPRFINCSREIARLDKNWRALSQRANSNARHYLFFCILQKFQRSRFLTLYIYSFCSLTHLHIFIRTLVYIFFSCFVFLHILSFSFRMNFPLLNIFRPWPERKKDSPGERKRQEKTTFQRSRSKNNSTDVIRVSW